MTKLNATWRDLLKELKKLDDEQLDANLCIRLAITDEYFSSSNNSNGVPTVLFKEYSDSDDVNEDNPIIVVQF